jgi:transcriptional regulator with XRE-family HTH domain
MVAAARMLAGIDQATLGEMAGVSGGTVSNVERGNEVRDETIKAVRKALKLSGISAFIDSVNGKVIVSMSYDDSDNEED